MQPTKLTEAFIRRLTYEDKPFIVRDTTIKGFMIAVNKRSKSYKVQRDLWVGQRGRRRKVGTIRHTLGTTDDFSLDDARTRAMQVLAEIKKGIDPNTTARADGVEGWTVEQMIKAYEEDLRARECSPRTIDDVDAQFERYLHRLRQRLAPRTREARRRSAVTPPSTDPRAAKRVAGGVYFHKLVAGDYSVTRKLVVLK